MYKFGRFEGFSESTIALPLKQRFENGINKIVLTIYPIIDLLDSSIEEIIFAYLCSYSHFLLK